MATEPRYAILIVNIVIIDMVIDPIGIVIVNIVIIDMVIDPIVTVITIAGAGNPFGHVPARRVLGSPQRAWASRARQSLRY